MPYIRFAALALLLTACSSGAVEEGRSAAIPAGGRGLAPGGPAIRVLAPQSDPLAALQRLLARHEAQTGVRVEIETRRDRQAVLDALEQDVASKRGAYDLVMVPNEALGRLVERGYLRPLEPYLAERRRQGFDPEADLFPGWWRLTSWYRDKPYGYPLLIRAMSVWYRSDLSDDEEADAFYTKYRHRMDPSTTWDDFAHVAEFLHRPERGLFGVAVVGAAEDALWYQWLQYAYGFGARILDAAGPDLYGDIVVNSTEAIRATDYYVKLQRWAPPDARQLTEADVLRAFQEGRVAAGVMWHDLAPRVEALAESKMAGRYAYSPLPAASGRRATLSAADLLVIPETAPHAREAFELMQWALGHEAQLSQTMSGGLSARPSVYEDESVKRNGRLYTRMFPYLIAGAVSPPTIPEADEIARLMSGELARVVRGELAAKTALDSIARQLERLLAGKAKLRRRPD
jgi:multiple sugar transport system substrate-binding protein